MKKKGTLVTNNAPAAPATIVHNLELVTFNLQSNLVRKETLDGRDYTVVPMVMLTVGVHAGSKGPLLYPAQELGKTPEVWNTKPIVVYHPVINGVGASACDPIILETRGIGMIMNTKFEDDKLKSEAWLDAAKVQKVDPRVAVAIENQEMMELSTGVFTDNEMKDGDWNGQHYNSIARNYRPDHLAVLPDQIGACSMADGAGLLRLNQAHSQVPVGVLERASSAYLAIIKLNQMSHSNVRDALRTLIREQYNGDDVWVEDVYDSFFVFEVGGKLYRQAYTETDTQVSIVGEKEEVVRVTEYRTLDGTFVGNEKESSMDKKKTVDDLIKNSNWEESDREFLMALEDAQLGKMVVKNAQPEGDDNQDVQDAAAAGGADVTPPAEPPAETPPTANAQPTVQEYINNAPADMQDVLRSGLASHEAEKARLIKVIVANEKNVFTAQELQTKNLSELKNIAILAAKPAEVNSPNPIYAGEGDLAQNVETEEALPAPAMTFDNSESK